MENLLTYSEAIAAVRSGKKVRSKGWNGKNMYLEYVKGELRNGRFYHDYIALVRPTKSYSEGVASEELIPWSSWTLDIFSDEWEIIE